MYLSTHTHFLTKLDLKQAAMCLDYLQAGAIPHER